MKIDYHVHSEFSDDSQYDMEEIVKGALQQGLEEICFTDHVDYGIKKDWTEENIVYHNDIPITNVNYPEYFKKYEYVKKKYPEIALKIGLEFGIQTHTIPQFELLYSKYPLDFVILSCHQVDNQQFWTQDFQKNKTQKEYNERYYDEILNVIQAYKNYSVLGHLDMIVRYDLQGIYPFEKLKNKITEILKIVIQDGKGIEVNTSSFRYKLNDLTPSRDILQLYYDLGGEIITIGSDSHQPEHLGNHIEEIKVILKEIGFKHFYTYDHMQPIPHEL